MTGVCRALVTFLDFKDVFSEHSVKFIEVRYEISSPSKGNVMIGVNGDGRVIAFVGIEWEDTSGSVRSVVVCEFCEREKHISIILLKVNVHSEVLFESLIHSFSLSVSFRMITGGKVNTHI